MFVKNVSIHHNVEHFDVLPSPYSLTIGTPCFGGQVSWLYAVSLLKLQKAFTQRGWHLII